MEELCSLLKKLKFPHPLNKPGNKNQHIYTLESTVICVCFNSNCPSKKYFGASLGCKTDNAKSIMIFSSCINTWHMYVSYAVMSFTYTQESNGLMFPEDVKCQAFLRNWQDNTYKEISPCKNCQNMFNLPGEDTEKKHYPYGNCAETECLSKLLLQDNIIQENTKITSYTQDKMAKLKEQTKNDLKKKLQSICSMAKNDCLPVFNPGWYDMNEIWNIDVICKSISVLSWLLENQQVIWTKDIDIKSSENHITLHTIFRFLWTCCQETLKNLFLSQEWIVWKDSIIKW